MSPSSINKKTSSSCTFKTLATKVKTKLEKVKCRKHKSKASNDTTQVIAKPEANDVLAEFKAVVANMPKPANYHTRFIIEPNRSAKDAHEAVVDVATPEHTSEDGHNRCDIKTKQQGLSKKQACREARRAKWAARRTSFKCKAKKVGEAILLSAAVAGGLIFAPVILTVSILFAVVKFLIWLVVKILDLLCCGPVLVCFVCKEAM